MSTEEHERIKAMIREAVNGEGLSVIRWSTDEDGELQAHLGRFAVNEDDEDYGFYSDCEGEMLACVVGAQKYGNEHVAFLFLEDDMESPNRVNNLHNFREIDDA